MTASGHFSGSRFRKAIRAFIFGRIAQSLGTFALTLLVIRLLRPADYGAYMTLWGIIELFVPLTSLGLLQAVQRFLPELASHGDPNNLKAFVRGVSLARFSVLLTFSGMLAWQWDALSHWLGFTLGQRDEALLAVWLVVTVLGERFVAEMLESLLEQGYAQVVRALEPIGRLVGVAALLAFNSVSLNNVFLVDLIASAVCLILAEVFLGRQLAKLNPAGKYRVTLREVAGFTWHMFGWQWLNAAGGIGVLRIIVARMLGLEIAGQFAFLQQLTIIISRYLPGTLLANIIRPMLISRHATGQTEDVAAGLGVLLKGNFLLLAAGIVALAAGGDALLNLASGSRVQHSGLVMLLMVVSLVGSAQGQVLAMGMQLYRYTSQLRNFSFLALMMPFLVWIGTHFGLVGVALGMILELWFRNGLILVWLQNQPLKADLDWPGYLRTLVIVLLLTFIALATSLFSTTFVLNPWVAIIIFSFLYILGLRIIRPLGAREYALIQKAAGIKWVGWAAAWARAQ